MQKFTGWCTVILVFAVGVLGVYAAIYDTPYEYCANRYELWRQPPKLSDCDTLIGIPSLAERWGWE